jgi:class 3 adenylate cyclase
VALLNEFFAVVVPIIEEHGGHANKFLGDGLLAGFGAPVECDDHALRAVDAAHEIADAVQATFAGALRVGIGINTGSFIVGTVGGGTHLEFALIGDVVNVAARVEQLTKDTGDAILATDTTVAALPADHVALVPRGTVQVRGRQQELGVFALNGLTPQPRL